MNDDAAVGVGFVGGVTTGIIVTGGAVVMIDGDNMGVVVVIVIVGAGAGGGGAGIGGSGSGLAVGTLVGFDVVLSTAVGTASI